MIARLSPGWSPLPSALLVMAPHPDDDVLGCSRLMQRTAACGGRIVVTWLTDGGGSHGDLTPDRRKTLVDRRRREALAGLDVLGVKPEALYFFDFADGYLSDHHQDASAGLKRVCARHGVRTAVVTDKEDGHPDHRAAFQIALGLGVERLFSYPVSGRYDGEVYAPPDGVLRLSGGAEDVKRQALLQHRSQMEAEATYPLSTSAIDRFCAEPEIFIPIERTAR